MATARELLEQADALMRRDRSRDEDGEDVGSGIPLLTEVVGSGGGTASAPVAGTGVGGKPGSGANGAALAASVLPAAAQAGDDPAASDVDDVPLLTDVVADLDPISVIGSPQDGGEPSQWPHFAVREHRLDPWTVGGPASSAPPAPPVPAVDVDWHDAATPVPMIDSAAAVVADPPAVFTLVPDADLAATGSADAPQDTAAGGAGEAARWEALAEEVRMQVLQRIDIFTDTGLQEQLTARLQPIVDRASADLVATINQQVGQLLRAYVAEAIEREIDKWRQDGA